MQLVFNNFMNYIDLVSISEIDNNKLKYKIIDKKILDNLMKKNYNNIMKIIKTHGKDKL